jgi:excisionase family DNA binding protein
VNVSLDIPPELIEVIATRAAEIVIETTGSTGSPWMTRTEAAAYLRFPVSRLEKDRRIPCHRDGGRVLYHRAELDAHFLALGR